MFLSTLLIDTGVNPDRPRPARLWLRNLYRIHQRLAMAFPSAARRQNDPFFLRPYRPDDFSAPAVHVPRSENAGFLFRVDPGPPGRAVIVVLSALRPDWDYAFHNAPHFLAAPPLVRLYDPVFQTGQRLRFRLLANATRKIDTATGPDGKRRNGRRVPVRPERIRDWLFERAASAGFQVEQETLRVQTGYVCLHRPHDEVPFLRFFAARYEGLLTVLDPHRFRNAVQSGIGPAKAFGFGLLTVGPASPLSQESSS